MAGLHVAPWLEATATTDTPSLGQGEELVFRALGGASLIWEGGRGEADGSQWPSGIAPGLCC